MSEEIQQRWYDREPQLAQAVNLLDSFPIETQVIIAEGVVSLAEQQCQARETATTLQSVGTDKILGLHKSQQKRRNTDHHPTLNRAMNYLYLLNPNHQQYMATQINKVLDLLFDDLETAGAQEVKDALLAVSPTPEDHLLIAIQNCFSSQLTLTQSTAISE